MFRECVATLMSASPDTRAAGCAQRSQARSRVLVFGALFAALCPACSFILDFDQALPDAVPLDGVSTKSECDFGEPNNTAAEGFAVTSADAGPGAICPGAEEDHDFYTFTAGTGPTTLTINFTQRTGGDLDLKLYDATGTMIASSREFGPMEKLVCPAASPLCPALTSGAQYTFEVFPGVAGSVNTYTFSIAP